MLARNLNRTVCSRNNCYLWNKKVGIILTFSSYNRWPPKSVLNRWTLQEGASKFQEVTLQKTYS